MIIEIPHKVNKRDINIQFNDKYIKIESKEIHIEGELLNRINTSNCLWGIDDNGLLIVTINKFKSEIWPRLFKNDKNDQMKNSNKNEKKEIPNTSVSFYLCIYYF